MANWETDWNRDVLEHIVALLFALADLADLAANAPFLRRRQVLAILSHGEAEARTFLVGPAIPAQTPGEADDAAGLAARLRMLALFLCATLAQAGQSAHPGAGDAQAGQRRQEPSGSAGRRRGTPAPHSPDTS